MLVAGSDQAWSCVLVDVVALDGWVVIEKPVVAVGKHASTSATRSSAVLATTGNWKGIETFMVECVYL